MTSNNGSSQGNDSAGSKRHSGSSKLNFGSNAQNLGSSTQKPHTAPRQVVMPNEVLLPEIVALMNEGHTVTLRLKGYSMRPFLEDNRDKALMKRAEHFEVGDPVLAEVGPRHYVLHRIVAIDGDRVTLRGDGNLGIETCRKQDVKAEIIGFYRKDRTKLDRVDGRKWRIYSWWWMRLLPVRRYLLAAYRRLWIPVFGPV